MDQHNVENDCSLIQAISLLGKKWVIFILAELIINQVESGKGMYFNELQKRVTDNYGGKISSRVLTDSLQLLERTGIVNRIVQTGDKPIRVLYSLTDKGIDFQIVLSALKGWGIKHGGVKQKVCQSFSCIHNSVPFLNIEKSWDILISKKNRGKDIELL